MPDTYFKNQALSRVYKINRFLLIRSNPELCISSDGDSDSDGGISASQAASRLQDRLKAVRSFILSDSKLYSQILQYKPLVLSQLQEQLKAAGIRLGAAKLMDYLDSQCITFTTAKPGHAAPSCRRVKRTGKAGKSRWKGGKRGKRHYSRTFKLTARMILCRNWKMADFISVLGMFVWKPKRLQENLNDQDKDWLFPGENIFSKNRFITM